MCKLIAEWLRGLVCSWTADRPRGLVCKLIAFSRWAIPEVKDSYSVSWGEGLIIDLMHPW